MKHGQRGHRVNQPCTTHIGWRPDPALKARWLAFLKAQPPINRTKFLDQALTYYLDQAARYGLDPRTLRPHSKP